jgi:hypothetical protein
MPGETRRCDGFAHTGGASRVAAALRACIGSHKTGKRLGIGTSLHEPRNVIIFSIDVAVMSRA